MKHNVGTLDSTVRVAVGIALIAFFFIADSPVRWWGILGVVPLLTAALGYCPLYAVFGLSTCPVRRPRAIDGE